jgi:hypothetical protein
MFISNNDYIQIGIWNNKEGQNGEHNIFTLEYGIRKKIERDNEITSS